MISTHLITDRIILRTLDNKVLVRPIVSKNSIISLSPKLDATLSELGVSSWNDGLDLTSDCFSCYIDTRCYRRIDFD